MMRRLAALLLALGLCTLAACTGLPTTETLLTQPTTQQSTGPASTLPERATGGSLRLWWPTRTTLNPLCEVSRTGQAALDLVYEGLFKINPDDSLSFGLAKRIMAFEGNLQILIAVQDEKRFHDGRPVTSQDVVACLEYLLEPGCSSIWAFGLNKITSVAALDEKVVEIRLSEPDPWLAWSLVFPIIPADQVSLTDFSIFAGTGPYQVRSHAPESGTELVASSRQEADLPLILLKEYQDQAQAMQALENDQLDLVLLDSWLYSSYLLRSSLRLEYFTGNEVFFLAYNSQPGSQLAMQMQLADLKGVLAAWRSEDDLFSSWVEKTAFAGSRQSIFCPAGREPKRLLNSGLEAADLKIIVPAEDRRRQKLVDQIALYLQDQSVNCHVETLADENFQLALQEGAYDLALLAATLPPRPAFDFLYRQPPESHFAGLALIRQDGIGLADEELWQQKLLAARPWQKLYPNLDLNSNEKWLEAVSELTYRAPWDIICLPYAGIVYGDRVRGQCRPDRYHPYTDIKELWLWSTQS